MARFNWCHYPFSHFEDAAVGVEPSQEATQMCELVSEAGLFCVVCDDIDQVRRELPIADHWLASRRGAGQAREHPIQSRRSGCRYTVGRNEGGVLVGSDGVY